MVKYSRWGKQKRDRMETLFASYHAVFTMKQTPPPFHYFASAVLSMRNTKKESDGVTARSGTRGVSCILVTHKMLQFLELHWNFNLALRSSSLFSRDVGKQDAGQWRTISPFSQSVLKATACPTVFLCSASWGGCVSVYCCRSCLAGFQQIGLKNI